MSKLTFWQAISDNSHQISVPVIQRDYAQGRNSKKALQVRTHFLNSLAEYIQASDDPQNAGKKLSLDFIYGAESALDVTELIDGQQRFTTLFLLHTYFAIKDNASEAERKVLQNL